MIEEENKFGIMDVLNNPAIKYNPLNPMFAFNTIKTGFSKAGEKAMDVYREYLSNKLKEERAARDLQIERNRIQQIIDSGSSVDPSSGGQFGSSVNEATGARGSGTGFSNYS